MDPTASLYPASMSGILEFSGTPLRKSDRHKGMITSGKSKHIKPKTKTKHFRLFKKRNLNSKISKELRIADFQQMTPIKSKGGKKPFAM